MGHNRGTICFDVVYNLRSVAGSLSSGQDLSPGAM